MRKAHGARSDGGTSSVPEADVFHIPEESRTGLIATAIALLIAVVIALFM